MSNEPSKKEPQQPSREELLALVHALVHQGSILHNLYFERNQTSIHTSGWRRLVWAIQQATNQDFGVNAKYHRKIDFKRPPSEFQ